jgi:hypothetical protein
MHIHSYRLLGQPEGPFRLDLESRWSTDANGISKCLGLKAEPKVELDEIIRVLEEKISDETLLTLR